MVTGIHLTSYGRDLNDGTTLLNALQAVQDIPGILRIRLGSLEPTVATHEFAQKLRTLDKICPQFHLALQSGSDTVLARMARRYNTRMYLDAAANLREAFPDCALTTDVLTGFPGETEEEFRETCDFIRKIGYARIHVFPYSQREGTKAAVMPGQLSNTEKDRRTRILIGIGNETAKDYGRSWIGRNVQVLLEEKHDDSWIGYTPEYIQVAVEDCPRCGQGVLLEVRLTDCEEEYMKGILL